MKVISVLISSLFLVITSVQGEHRCVDLLQSHEVETIDPINQLLTEFYNIRNIGTLYGLDALLKTLLEGKAESALDLINNGYTDYSTSKVNQLNFLLETLPNDNDLMTSVNKTLINNSLAVNQALNGNTPTSVKFRQRGPSTPIFTVAPSTVRTAVRLSEIDFNQYEAGTYFHLIIHLDNPNLIYVSPSAGTRDSNGRLLPPTETTIRNGGHGEAAIEVTNVLFLAGIANTTDYADFISGWRGGGLLLVEKPDRGLNIRLEYRSRSLNGRVDNGLADQNTQFQMSSAVLRVLESRFPGTMSRSNNQH